MPAKLAGQISAERLDRLERYLETSKVVAGQGVTVATECHDHPNAA